MAEPLPASVRIEVTDRARAWVDEREVSLEEALAASRRLEAWNRELWQEVVRLRQEQDNGT